MTSGQALSAGGGLMGNRLTKEDDKPYEGLSSTFYTNEKLVNHFRDIHEREHAKRVNQIESARGKRRVNMVAKFSMKMEKYMRDVLMPKVGYGLADELKQARFWVRTISDNPQAADVALRNHMVDVMDHRRADCLVLVSDDSDFVNVLKEAKMRCLRTVVVGNLNDGLRKRVADSRFSWRDILMGKARKQAPSVMSRWNDQDILKKLEWTYNPEADKNASGFDFVSDGEVKMILGQVLIVWSLSISEEMITGHGASLIRAPRSLQCKDPQRTLHYNLHIYLA
ncbi:hypothetical protein MLD38_020901 [Melastoma candidum]|uniref:Uncharacterized protein n=1 Tax=Melastoma candidum TaxID=119954 RepID=A0ACB9QEX3_9MYRT|nr:hypothetical protein MLD38_020901 [Melastoma candidum]